MQKSSSRFVGGSQQVINSISAIWELPSLPDWVWRERILGTSLFLHPGCLLKVGYRALLLFYVPFLMLN